MFLMFGSSPGFAWDSEVLPDRELPGLTAHLSQHPKSRCAIDAAVIDPADTDVLVA